MKILQVNSAKHFGGGEKHFIDLARGLMQRGHEIAFVLRNGCEWSERMSSLGAINVRRFPLRNSADIASAIKIANVIRREKIDIVHAHLARDYSIASFAVRLAPRAKLILTRHVLFRMKRAQSMMLSNVSRVIAVSDAVADVVARTFSKDKIRVVLNGINFEEQTDEDRTKGFKEFRFEHEIPFDAPLIGTLGELKKLKGQEEFILASQIIAKEIPSARFVVVGEDKSFDKKFRNTLKRLVKVFGLEDRFLWLNWINDTRAFHSAVDVFVSPSHTESFGLAILEAMANGCAIVATETEGAKLLLDGGRNGTLVGCEKPTELSAAIIELLRNDKLRRDLGERSKKFAKSKFSLDRMVEETEAVYRETLI